MPTYMAVSGDGRHYVTVRAADLTAAARKALPTLPAGWWVTTRQYVAEMQAIHRGRVSLGHVAAGSAPSGRDRRVLRKRTSQRHRYHKHPSHPYAHLVITKHRRK